MLGWFRSKPECPVSPAAREWIDDRWLWLEGQFGSERLRKTKVILPRPEYFPDAYHGTGEDVRRNYSLCVAPEEGELKVTVKRIAGGRYDFPYIARQVGYGSQYAFAHAFKREYGQAPGTFRNT